MKIKNIFFLLLFAFLLFFSVNQADAALCYQTCKVPGDCISPSCPYCSPATKTCQPNPILTPTPAPTTSPCKSSEAWTALGCIPTGSTDFVSWLLARAILLGGGLAFLLMIWGSFQVLTSSGDPQKLQNGKEVFTSAISGLLFIILSLFLLRLIGVDILKIPGFIP